MDSSVRIRSSLLAVLSNCPTVQVLVYKRCHRYFRKVEDEPRFITHFVQAVRSNVEDNLYGFNIISYWPQVEE